MVIEIDMKTGKLISTRCRVIPMMDTVAETLYQLPQPALQTLPAEPESRNAFPPELADVCPDEFLDRWQR